jgi:Ca2+/Na+ antiporter
MIQVRKLVAIELAFLRPKFVLAEYAIAVAGGVFLGVLSLRVALMRTHATWQILLGIYLFFLALNYAVLLGYAIAMARRGDAREEIADELDDKTAAFRKYRRQSLWLLVPLAAPIASIMHRRDSSD